jgi:hypothetical protein
MTNDASSAKDIAAALNRMADAIVQGKLPNPHSVDFWKHNLSVDELLGLADHFGVGIVLHETHAGAKIRPIGLEPITFYFLSNDLDDNARRAYDQHNEECIAADPLATRPTEPDPCAAGCDDPEMHAEGGHDV